MLVGHLGDVHQALDALAQVDESAERDKLGHSALDDSADGVLLDQCAPRILGGLLETQGDALAVEIDVENLDLDLLADLDNLGRMVDVVPGELGDVDEAVDTAEVDEGAEVDDGGNGAWRRMPDLSLDRISERSALRDSSSTTRRERTTLLRLRSISMTRASMRVPM